MTYVFRLIQAVILSCIQFIVMNAVKHTTPANLGRFARLMVSVGSWCITIFMTMTLTASIEKKCREFKAELDVLIKQIKESKQVAKLKSNIKKEA